MDQLTILRAINYNKYCNTDTDSKTGKKRDDFSLKNSSDRVWEVLNIYDYHTGDILDWESRGKKSLANVINYIPSLTTTLSQKIYFTHTEGGLGTFVQPVWLLFPLILDAALSEANDSTFILIRTQRCQHQNLIIQTSNELWCM